MDKLSDAVREAEQVAKGIALRTEAGGAILSQMPDDPVLSKLIEVASIYIHEPDVADAFSFPVAHDFAR